MVNARLGKPGGLSLQRYRYRTAALKGPWRESPDLAMRDAARARQARIEEGPPPRIEWTVPGRIEEGRDEGGARV
jgi:hypothetical protein